MSPWISWPSALWRAFKRGVCRPLSRLRNRHLLLWDVVMQPLVVATAFALRLDGFAWGGYHDGAFQYALLSALVVPAIFYLFGMYRRFWRYASLAEAELVVLGSLAACVATAGLYFLVLAPAGFVDRIPRSIPLIALLLLIVTTPLPRFGLRLANTYRLRAHRQGRVAPPLRVLIAGAGDAGNMVLREMLHNPQIGYQPVGFVDDDPSKCGLEVSSCRVLGTTAQIPELVRQYKVQRVIIAMPSAGGAIIRRLTQLCRAASVETLTLPGISELLSGRATVDRLRRVRVEDLLRREPVQIDRAQVQALLGKRCILVTGAGGSIGGEICRQAAQCGPSRLILVGHGENSIYHIERELRSAFPDLPIEAVIADLRDRPRLDAILARHRPEIVLHAAAHKHVPLMQSNAPDAVTNNILGTRHLVEAAIAHDVAHLVMISSDKAVNPTNVMGATKRVAELVVQDAARRSGRAFTAVRFGNVLGSRGSVVPLFEAQIAAGGPVTVTHPDVKRYFMTIPEAVQLVLQAAAFGQGDEIFVLDMGEPLRIADLARDMIELAGYIPEQEIAIQYVGLRPGEKLFEELSIHDEVHVPSPHDKIFVLRHKEGVAHPADRFNDQLEALLRAASEGDEPRLLALLHEIVPEYHPENGA